MLRIGKVSSIDAAKATAKVVFESSENMVSYNLPVLYRQTKSAKDYWMPDIGESVVCVFLPNDQSNGFILGAFYVEDPPATSADIRKVIFDDGTEIEYNSGSHTLTIDAAGPINITAAGNVNITGDVIVDGISFKEHVHSDPQGGTTGGPQ